MSNPGNMTYDESDHPRMGTFRKSIEKNEMLIKPVLGTVKRPTRDLPGEDFIYGILNRYGDGVREAMVHQETVPDPHATRGPDIRAMNKQASKMHVVRAAQQREYRKENPLKLKINKRMVNVPPLPSKRNPEHVYGKPLPRGEAMDEVITYGFAEDWIKMNQQHEHDFQSNKPHFVPPKTTKTVVVRSDSCYQKYNPPPPKERFVMSKFKSVGHKIDNVQTTPLLRDERSPVSKTSNSNSSSNRKGGFFCGEGSYPPSCLWSLLPAPLPGPQRSDPEMSSAAVPRRFQQLSSGAQLPLPGLLSRPGRSEPQCDPSPPQPPPPMRGPRRSDPD